MTNEARVLDVVNFMPETVVQNVAGDGPREPFFGGVQERRFASPELTTVDLCVGAARKIMERNDIDGSTVDYIICAAMFNDHFTPGPGPAVQEALSASNAGVLHIDTGCSGWISAMSQAFARIESGRSRRVLVITATNFISRLEEFRSKRESEVLGDGASAALVESSDVGTALAVEERTFGADWAKLNVSPLDSACSGQYWSSSGSLGVSFSRNMLAELWEMAQARLPEVYRETLAVAGIESDAVDLFVTHQPNERLLQRWRELCGPYGPENTHDTLSHYGNMFHSTLPVTFADALDRGLVNRGDIIGFLTFTNTGEQVSSMLWRW